MKATRKASDKSETMLISRSKMVPRVKSRRARVSMNNSQLSDTSQRPISSTSNRSNRSGYRRRKKSSAKVSRRPAQEVLRDSQKSQRSQRSDRSTSPRSKGHVRDVGFNDSGSLSLLKSTSFSNERKSGSSLPIKRGKQN